MTRFPFIQISGNIEVLLSEGGHRRVGSISRRRWCIERGHVPSTSHIISTDRAKSVSALWNEWCVRVYVCVSVTMYVCHPVQEELLVQRGRTCSSELMERRLILVGRSVHAAVQPWVSNT